MMKELLRGKRWLFEVNPGDLNTFEEFAEYLESILHDPCSVWEQDGNLKLLIIKARVDTVHGMKIEIYPNEHAPPHFHVRSAKVNASFKIKDCSILKGSIAPHDYNKIRYWHQEAKPLLIECWNSLRPTQCTAGHYRETT